MAEGLATFNERLKRINDPRNVGYQDSETGMWIPKHMSKATIMRNAKARAPSLMALLLSLAVGAICLMLAPLARVYLLDMATVDVSSSLVDLAFAGIAALMFGSLIKHKTMRHMIAQGIGACLMLVAGHNLVWEFPDVFEVVYTAENVAQVQAHTSPYSLIVNGQTYSM